MATTILPESTQTGNADNPLSHERELSYFTGGITSTTPETTTTLNSIAAAIKRDPKCAALIANVRSLSGAAQDAAKEGLPYFTASGVFSARKDSLLIAHSGLVGLDIDNATLEGALALRDAAGRIKATALAFISPRSNGVKIIAAIAPIPTTLTHSDAYDFVANYYGAALGLPVLRTKQAKDEADGAYLEYAADLSRACFMSADPDCYYDSEPEGLSWQAKGKTEQPKRYKDVDWASIAFDAVNKLRPGKYNERLSTQDVWRFGNRGSLVIFRDSGYITDFENDFRGRLIDFIGRETGGGNSDAGITWLRGAGLLGEPTSRFGGRGEPVADAARARAFGAAELPFHLREYPGIQTDIARGRAARADLLSYFAPEKAVILRAESGQSRTLRGQSIEAQREMRKAIMTARGAAVKEYRGLLGDNPEADNLTADFAKAIEANDDARHWRSIQESAMLLGDELPDYGAPYDQTERRLIALRGGGAYDVCGGKAIGAAELRGMNLLDPEFEMQRLPDFGVLESKADIAKAMRAHYGEFALGLVSLGLMGAGIDWITTILGPPGYGKTLMLDMLEGYFGTIAIERHTAKNLTAAEARFSAYRRGLTRAILNIADECDKSGRLDIGLLMQSTNRTIKVELKGQDVFPRPRSAAPWIMGNRRPKMDWADGIERRMRYLCEFSGAGISRKDAGLFARNADVFVAIVLDIAREWADIHDLADWLDAHADNKAAEWAAAATQESEDD